MAKTVFGTSVVDELPEMPCGGIPIFDYCTGYGYRCDLCNAVIGSVAQSNECKFLNSGNGDGNRNQ